MQFTSALLFIAASLAPLALAGTHYAGLCVDYEGGQNVYNDAATKAACGNYFMRNKGTEWWNTCPDCKMVSALVSFSHRDNKLTC